MQFGQTSAVWVFKGFWREEGLGLKLQKFWADSIVAIWANKFCIEDSRGEQ